MESEDRAKSYRATRTEAIMQMSVTDRDPSLVFKNFLSPASFWTPENLNRRSAWLEHAPFAYWLMGVLCPRTLVELGTEAGFSYFSFCQAVQRLDLKTDCYAIDTWKGDEHTGFYGQELFAQVTKHNEQNFSAFSTLIRSTFDDALSYFIDGSVDLLHIDGRHFYDDVKHDFENWRSKLSDRSVVLFHDINVRERDFGVFRLWNELIRSHPHFAFAHGHGLGVLGVGNAVPGRLGELFSASKDGAAASLIQQTYGRLGAAVVFQVKSQCVDVVEQELTSLKSVQAEQATAVTTLNQSMAQRANEIDALLHTLSDRDSTLSSLEEVLCRAREQLASARAQSASSQTQRGELEAALREVREELISSKAAREQLEIGFGKILQRLVASEADRHKLSQALDEGGRQLASTAKKLSSADMQLNQQQEDAARQRRELELKLNTLQLSLDAVMRSTVWRMTAAPRAVLSRLPSVRRVARQAIRAMYWVATPWKTPARIAALRHRAAAKRRLSHPQGLKGNRSTEGQSPSDGTSLTAGNYQIEYHATKPERFNEASKRVVVCLTHELPWPPRQANQYIIGRLVEWLSRKGYQVFVLVVPMSGAILPDDYRDAAFQKCDNILVCYNDGHIQASIKTLDVPLDGLNGKPVTAVFNRCRLRRNNGDANLHKFELERCHEALIGLAVEITKKIPDAIWYINYAFMTRVLNYLPQTIVSFVDTHDIFSQKPKKVFAYGVRGETLVTADEERRMLERADALLAMCRDDAKELRRLVVGKTVLTRGIEFDCVNVGPPSAKPTILMVANDNPLNTKGIKDFLRFAWPAIKGAVRDVELVLVGSIGRVVHVDDPRVTTVGMVDCLTPYYERAHLAINPAVAGTGLKIKTLESLAHMRPIVTWPAGVDGIDQPLVGFCHVAKNWYEFGERVIGLLANRADEENKITSTRKMIEAMFRPDAAYRELESWLKNV